LISGVFIKQFDKLKAIAQGSSAQNIEGVEIPQVDQIEKATLFNECFALLSSTLQFKVLRGAYDDQLNSEVSGLCFLAKSNPQHFPFPSQ
jgi:hypothetical protein